MISAAALTKLGIDAATWLRPLTDAMGLHAIDTPEREAMFLAQCAHESAGFKHLVENLNYSPQGLLATFPRYFTAAKAVEFAHDAERIASRVYANRNGNGDEVSGDGWRYRGRGLIQLTGRANYDRCGRSLGIDLLAEPEQLEQPLGAALSAAWYWHTDGCNELADANAFASITRRINGGNNGQAEREAWLARARAAL